MPKKQSAAISRRVAAIQSLSDLVGNRGEIIFELAITDYEQFKSPLFKPSFLGAKWPTIDYYVELLGVPGSSPFFFAQVKATTEPLSDTAGVLEIKVARTKCDRLFRIPGPTYIVGVHEPEKKAYILSIHAKPDRGVYRIPRQYELTPDNLRLLHKEVCAFWRSFPHKPTESNFK